MNSFSFEEKEKEKETKYFYLLIDFTLLYGIESVFCPLDNDIIVRIES